VLERIAEEGDRVILEKMASRLCLFALSDVPVRFIVANWG